MDGPDLSPFQYHVASLLAMEETTHDTAIACRVTDGRISQLRRELLASWRKFIGDDSVRFAL